MELELVLQIPMAQDFLDHKECLDQCNWRDHDSFDVYDIIYVVMECEQSTVEHQVSSTAASLSPPLWCVCSCQTWGAKEKCCSGGENPEDQFSMRAWQSCPQHQRLTIDDGLDCR